MADAAGSCTSPQRLATLDGAERPAIANAQEAQRAVERIQKAHFAGHTASSMSEKRKIACRAVHHVKLYSRKPAASWASRRRSTMQVVQQLYEGIDLGGRGHAGYCVSYIRTDTVRISAMKP